VIPARKENLSLGDCVKMRSSAEIPVDASPCIKNCSLMEEDKYVLIGKASWRSSTRENADNHNIMSQWSLAVPDIHTMRIYMKSEPVSWTRSVTILLLIQVSFVKGCLQ